MRRSDNCLPELGGRAQLRRRRVMNSARALFIEHGFHATGMAQIAKSSGVAINQIYRDFASKENIVVALVETDCGRLMMFEALRAAVRDDDTESVRHWLREFVEPSDDPDDARLFAEILAEAGRSDRIAGIFRQLQDELRRHIGAALHLIAPDDALAGRRAMVTDLIMTLSIGIFHQQLITPAAELADVARGIQATLDRELTLLAAAA